MARAAALVLLALGCWATGALPFHVTGIGLFVLATLLGIAPPRVIFAGFASSALWLVFGGLVIGARSRPRASAAASRASWSAISAAPTGGSSTARSGWARGLAFLVPAAMGRIMILMPIFAALTAELGFGPGRRGRTGILLAVAFGTILPAFAILPANLPNMVLLGVAETLYGVSISYGAYLLLHFPLLGLAYGLLLAELICRLFPDRADDRPPIGEAAPPRPLPPWSPAERRLLGHPGPGARCSGRPIRCMASRPAGSRSRPRWSACCRASGVIDPRTFETATSFGTFFYVAGLLGMVSLIDASGLAGALGAKALALAAAGAGCRPAESFGALVAAASLIGLVTTHPGVPAVLGPLAAPMAKAADLPLVSVLMTQIVGFSTMLLPYQSAPVMVALQLANLRLAAATRLSLLLGSLTLLVLVPLDYLWWR